MTQNKEEVKLGCYTTHCDTAHSLLPASICQAGLVGLVGLGEGSSSVEGREAMGRGRNQGCETSIFYRKPAVCFVGKTLASTSCGTKDVNFSGIGAEASWPTKKSGNQELIPTEFCAVFSEPTSFASPWSEFRMRSTSLGVN